MNTAQPSTIRRDSFANTNNRTNLYKQRVQTNSGTRNNGTNDLLNLPQTMALSSRIRYAVYITTRPFQYYSGGPVNTILYTKPNCVQCDATKRALAKSGIPHELVDITVEPDARDYVLSLGYLFSCRFENVSSMLGDGQQRPRRDTPILDTATPRRSFSAPPQRDRRRVVMSLQSLCRALPSESHAAG